jgi:uncharacterized protein
MSSQLTDRELSELMPSELVRHETPIPTQIVSSDEFYPDPQNERQREVEARLLAMADDLGKKQGLDRRKFFQSTAGMAASFAAMNEVYGPLFDVTKAEAATPAMADERANALKDQFIMDCHTHFLRDDTRIMTFLNMRIAVGKAGWNKSLADKEQSIEDLKYNNYVKEIFLDSDTKIALISSAPSDIEQDWFLTNEMMAQARDKLNKDAATVGNKRLMSHMIFTPGQPDWLDKLDAGLALKPDSCKGYTIGDNTHKDISRYPWRMDDQKVAYKGYEKMVAAGIKNVCIHKGLFAPGVEKEFPRLRGFADVADVGQAAKDWPQLNFIIYHSAYRHVGGDQGRACGVRSHRPYLLDERPCRHPSAVRGEQRLRRRRAALCYHACRRTKRMRGTNGHTHQGFRYRPRLLGHRCLMDRLAAVANRRFASARNPRRHAEEVRFRTARLG